MLRITRDSGVSVPVRLLITIAHDRNSGQNRHVKALWEGLNENFHMMH